MFAKTYGVHHGLEKRDRLTEFIFEHVTLGHGATVGLVMFLAGFVYTLHLLLNWVESGYKALPVLDQDIAGLTLLVIGLQTIFYSEIVAKEAIEGAQFVYEYTEGLLKSVEDKHAK